MRRIEDLISEYDITEKTGRKKIQIIKWFQERPGRRFDVAEVHTALGDELGIGQNQVRNYLNELVDDDVLQSRGEKRIAYQLADDIVVPARYQVGAALGHLGSVLNIERWGITGFFAIMTATWAGLTFPFWFLWGTLFISPANNYASITQPEFLRMAVAMTIWLLVFTVISIVLNRLRRQYRKMQSA